MQKISSEGTYFYKRIFPTFFFGFLLLLLTIVVFNGSEINPKSTYALLIVIPIFMIVIGFLIFKSSTFIIVDEVFDFSDYLLIKQSDNKIQVKLIQIQDIEYISGRQLKLIFHLKEECSLGMKIIFILLDFEIYIQ